MHSAAARSRTGQHNLMSRTLFSFLSFFPTSFFPPSFFPFSSFLPSFVLHPSLPLPSLHPLLPSFLPSFLPLSLSLSLPLSFSPSLSFFFYCMWLCVCGGICYHMTVGLRGQLCGVSYVLVPLYWFWELNLGYQACIAITFTYWTTSSTLGHIFKNRILFMLCEWLFFLHISMCTMYLPGAWASQKRATDLLELMNGCPGNWTQIFCKRKKCS